MLPAPALTASLRVRTMLESIATPNELSAGETLTSVGAVVSAEDWPPWEMAMSLNWKNSIP